MPPFSSLDSRAKAYHLGVLFVGVASIPAAWLLHPLSFEAVPAVLYLGVLTQIAALLPIKWRQGNQYVHDPLLVATGLFAPGPAVAIVAWVALFDGRMPGRDAPWWALGFNRANAAIDNVVASLTVVWLIPGTEWWVLPVRTVLYVVVALALNYTLTARGMSYVNRTPLWNTLSMNVGASTLAFTVVLGFSGGILVLLLHAGWVGYVMAPGLFGFLIAVRGNVADAQRQTELKEQTLDLAAQALDARDRYTESHSIRVAELASQLGERLELGDRECELLLTAGSLHDLGKIGVRDDILSKPGPLTAEEWVIMRRHADIGADMIAQHSALKEVAPLVRHHHERWDGSGYPAGYTGDTIPFGARILSVADSFDTITGPRLYRMSSLTPLEGVEDISKRSGQWYDPNVVDALRSLHGLKPLEGIDRPDVPRRLTTWRVLQTNAAFTRLLAAITISGLGDPLTQVATLISIYAVTRDARAVALAFIVQAAATILMSGALGGIADRFQRRRLVVIMELFRAGILVATPFLISIWLWLIIPVLFVLASINAVVQPARQAAIPELVPAGQAGKANAIVAAANMLAGSVGFAIAGGVLAIFQSTTILFIVDAATFATAAAIVLGLRTMGGGTKTIRVTGALRRAWSLSGARPHLVMAAFAAFLITMSFPALVALAYELNSAHGAQTYSLLEVVLSLGVFAGSLVVARATAIGTMRTVGAGLLVSGLFSLALSISPWLPLVALFLFLASVGNPIYTVGNQTALLEAADPANRGGVMATRFGIAQTAGMAGMATGGLITSAYGAAASYGALGIGLVIVGLYAFAAGRSMTSALHGAAYEKVTSKSS